MEHPVKGGRIMSDKPDYSWFAAVCLEQARRVKSEQEQKSYLEQARAWSRLAKQASNLRDSSVPPDKSIASD
jgi:hypothetical protein